MSPQRYLVTSVVMLLVSVACAAAEAQKQPSYTRFKSVFGAEPFDEAALLKHDYVSLLSEATVFTLHNAPREKEFVLLETQAPATKPNPRDRKPAASGFGTPQVLYARMKDGVKAFRQGAVIDGGSLESPWLLVSYAGAPDAPFDVPSLIVLARRPAEIRWPGARKLVASYDKPGTGWVARMPLYGWYKPSKKGGWSKAAPSPERDPRTWTWPESFPADVAKRCDYFTRLCRAFPVRAKESFSVDSTADTVTTRLDFEWLTVADDWNTRPLRLAPIQPILAFTQLYKGFPISFSAKIKDLDYMTQFGPFMGAEDVDRIEYTIPVGRYVNSVLELDKARLTTDVDRKVLENIQTLMERKFGGSDSKLDEWVHDHGGPQNFVWSFHSDSWYARAIPLVSADVAARAKRLWKGFMDGFALTPEAGWVPHRHRWVLAGPGSGAWGGFDDRGKLGSTTLLTVWAYGHFTGDWDLIRRHWDFIKGMYNTDMDSASWLEYCRKSHAEWGDIGAPSIALARMAWQVGDMDTHLYCTYLAGRQLVGHFAVMHGGKYFHALGPHRTDVPMPELVFPSNFNPWHGWWVNGPGFVPKCLPPEEQWTNIFVRMSCPDVGRFYKDSLAERMRWYLTNPGILDCARRCSMRQYLDYETRTRNPEYRQGPFLVDRDSHIRPGQMRLWGLLTDAPQAEVATKGPWEDWVGSGSAGKPVGNTSWHIASSYALLLSDPKGRKLTRVVDKGPATDFIAGHGREYWGKRPQGGPVDRWRENYVAIWPTTFFDGSIRSYHFGRTAPVGVEGTVEYSGQQRLDWTAVAQWSDFVPSRPSAGDPSQFDSPWLVCGPFDNKMDDAIEKAFPPEKAIDTSAAYTHADGVLPAHKEAVRWRQATPGKGVLDSQAIFGGSGDRAGYHLQHVHSPDARKATLVLGHHGAVKAWLNGKEIFYTHHHHDPYGVTDVPVSLKEGWNVLLIKGVSRRGKWRTSGHILGADGKAFDDLKYSAEPPK